MTTENNTAASETAAPAARAEWPQRFGKMTKLDIKTGRSGDYGIVTVDCGGKFTQTAFIFNAAALKKAQDAAVKAHAAGVQADVWMKGPIESVERGGFSKDEMKIVYFKDNTDYEASTEGDAPVADAGADAAVSEETAATAEAKDLDDEIPF
jgi:hypothetical protein